MAEHQEEADYEAELEEVVQEEGYEETGFEEGGHEQDLEDLQAAEQLAMEFLADPMQEEVIDPPNPPVQADNQSLRRSARISVRGHTKNYSPKRSRRKKKATIKSPITEADLLRALQTEALQAAPLDQGKSDAIDHYCGIAELGIPVPHGEGPSGAKQIDFEGNDEDYGESIIGDLEFNSEDDKFTDDEESGEGGH